jgi:methyltransferase-like protein/cyclopropane fatty-acyl-phospholipid synthase-like methyltransferase
MTAVNPTAYDEVKYLNYVYPQTHPDRLATIATLLGMTPARVEECRVLELACGDGANLIPMALDLPGSSFVGIDLAAQPIANGQRMIEELGLNNIRLQQLDLMAVSSEFEQFDYIIAHGLFSWVPATVRDRILALCRALLLPQGVAYISYNAYPGCRLREIARDIMRFHSKDVSSVKEKVGQGRAVLKWVADAQAQTHTYATLLREQSDKLAKRDEGSIYHDDLADINVPFYFHQFAEQAARHGLQFLSEADYCEATADSNFSAEVAQQMNQLGQQQLLAKEQYLDFLKGRSFRQTLLCHHEVELHREIEPGRIKGMRIKSEAEPRSAAPDIKSKSVEEFGTTKDGRAATDLPLAKAAFLHLGRIYPQAIPLEELVTQARALTEAEEAPFDDDVLTLAEVMIESYGAGVIELHLHEPGFTVEPGDFPLASPLARLQARQGNVVTTLLHLTLKLEDAVALQLLLLLDGTRDRDALVRELTLVIEATYAQLPADQMAEKEGLLESLPRQLEEKLVELGKLGLLLA